MEGPGNFFIKQYITHGLTDFRIKAQGEFPDIARAFICIEYLVDLPVFAFCLCVYDLAVLKFQPDTIKWNPVINRRSIVRDDPIDRVLDRSGKTLSIRNVAFAATGNRGNILD